MKLLDGSRLRRPTQADEIDRLRAALRSTVDALEALRRGHGSVVSGLCYPALNIGREALGAGANPNEQFTNADKT